MTPEQARTKLMEALRDIEQHCPCGARPASPKTHPHVISCPVPVAIESARLLLSASPGVEVRPLEWELNESGLKGQRAETPVGRYRVWPCPDNGSWAVRSDAMGMHIEPSESAAKFAADQHYRARIGLALRTAGGGG